MHLQHLAHLGSSESGREWSLRLPKLLDELIVLWDLENVCMPFTSANVSYAVKAERNGEPVVLKIQWPHDECEFEADALKLWNGDGSVALLAHDKSRHALLLEYCDPGQSLGDAAGVDKIGVIENLLPKLWLEANEPFQTLANEARAWQSRLYENWQSLEEPFERSVLEKVDRYIDQLLATPQQQVLVHQDLHGGNVLSAQRLPWLVIDPKPLIGEREFAIASVIRSPELGHSQADVIGRLTRLCNKLALDHERARRWAMVQTLCWSFDAGAPPTMLEVVRWLDAVDFSSNRA